jgi:hypothetical protein
VRVLKHITKVYKKERENSEKKRPEDGTATRKKAPRLSKEHAKRAMQPGKWRSHEKMALPQLQNPAKSNTLYKHFNNSEALRPRRSGCHPIGIFGGVFVCPVGVVGDRLVVLVDWLLSAPLSCTPVCAASKQPVFKSTWSW